MLIAQDRQSLFGIGGPSPSNPCGDRSGAAVLVLSNEDRASLSFEVRVETTEMVCSAG